MPKLQTTDTSVSRKKVLIVEDVSALSIAYSEQLKAAGYDATIAGTAAAASIEVTTESEIVAVLLDLHLPDADGVDLLKNGTFGKLPVIVITDDGSIRRAVEAMRYGAIDYLVKPTSHKQLVAAVDRAVTSGVGGAAPNRMAWAEPVSDQSDTKFIGDSEPMRRVFKLIDQVAASSATVMITGQTGTGKELCAERLHLRSERSSGPLIAINCGAIPDNLLESELFGHGKGAFTGAVANQIGAVMSADKGTLFLDEICEMPLQLQVKLLRFLQTGEVRPLGTNRIEKVDVRVVCATNRDPQHEVMAGRFREDLYYRLAVIPIKMPALRERKSDIPLLAHAFVDQICRDLGKPQVTLSSGFVAALNHYDWPGNVRELQNAMLRAVLLSEGPTLSVETLGLSLLSGIPAAESKQAGEMRPMRPEAGFEPSDAALPNVTLAETEKQAIQQAMLVAEGNPTRAAQILGISTATIYRKLKNIR